MLYCYGNVKISTAQTNCRTYTRAWVYSRVGILSALKGFGWAGVVRSL